MNSAMLEQLNTTGADISQTLEKFMNNEAIYIKFLKKFLADPNYEQLGVSLADKNYEEALKYAHTLKGVAGNLGLTPIFKISEKMVARFRNNDTDGIDDDYAELKKEYDTTVAIINANM